MYSDWPASRKQIITVFSIYLIKYDDDNGSDKNNGDSDGASNKNWTFVCIFTYFSMCYIEIKC